MLDMVRILLRCIISICLLFPNLSQANIWGSVGACITDPCGCGCSNVHETWNGISKSYKYYCNCPPYNKPTGRAGCLKKFSLPGESSVNYLSFCAEDPGGNSYFNPKVRVRMQACNVGACWTKAMNLNYDGQCTQWASPYGIPLLRLCARIAVPASSSANSQSDDGYTSHEHLNSEGATVDDKKVQTTVYDPVTETNIISSVFIDRPKLCVYEDPWMLDNALDLMDINPLYQPFHSGSGLSPIAEIMISIANMQMSLSQLMPQIMEQIGLPESLTNFLMKVINFVGQDIVVATIKTFGQLNRDVRSHLGCLEIPLGPFPPPYCSIMKPVSTAVTIDPICATVTADTGLCSGSSDCTILSDAINKCMSSSIDGVTNNAINNMVRIGFDNFIPICLPNTKGITPSTCVDILGVSTASAAHAFKDILPVCGSSPCVSTTLPVPSGNNGFRILYAIQYGATIFPPNTYYSTGTPDCPSAQGLSSGEPCQSVWGINAGPFRDVTLSFPATEYTSNNNTLISGSVSFSDLTGVSRSFKTSITRVQNPTDSGAVGLGITDQDQANICIYETTNSPAVLNGCTPRATAPMPQVTTGTGDNFNPTLNVTLTVGGNSTTGSVTVPAVDLHYTSVPTELNLAGFVYNSFVTDNYYNVAPFSDLEFGSPGSSPSAGFLYGAYMDGNNNLLSASTLPSDTDKYLYGMEYVNNKYRVSNVINGPMPQAAQICLSGVEVDSCPENPQNCVLAYLDRKDVVDCNTFFTKSASYPGLSKCNPYKTLCSPSTSSTPACTADPALCPTIVNGSCPADACTYVDNASGLAGMGDVNIYSCPDALGANYCYYYPTMDDICQVSKDPNKRIDPLTTDIILDPNEYYNYSIANANGTAVTESINAQKQISTDIVSCGYYLSTNGILPVPYSNITQCTSTCDAANIVEYFVSPDPNQILTICNTTVEGAATPTYCYTQGVAASSCQVSKILTLAYQPPVATPPNTAFSANVRGSAIIANQLSTSGSSVSCQDFLRGVNYSYAGMNACSPDQLTSCSTVVEKLSSTSPNTNVEVRQCSELSYCYNQTVGSTPCMLGCTGAVQQPIQMSCKSFLGKVTERDYSTIKSCLNPVCPPLSELQITYPTATSCTSTTPTCALAETLNSGSLTVHVNNCSAGYTVKDPNDLALVSDVATSFYCYDQPDSNCNLDTTNTTRTTADNVAIANPVTAVPPLVCPVATVTTPAAGSSLSCDNTDSYFNPAICGIRNKTDVERGLCAPVPALPNCPELANESHIHWPSAVPGIPTPVTAIGCVPGYSQLLKPDDTPYPLQRYCLVNPDASNVVSAVTWGPLLDSNAACVLTPTCPKVFPAAANNYTTVAGANADSSTGVNDTANITCASGYIPPSPSTVQCVRGTGVNINTVSFASYGNCISNCPKVLPTAANNYTTVTGPNADGSTSIGSQGTITCPSGSTVPFPSVIPCNASGSTGAFAIYSNCGTLKCPRIENSDTWTVSDSYGNAYWPSSDPSSAWVTGSCKFGYKKNGSSNPTRKCEYVYDADNNVIGAQWSTSVSNACVSKTCPSISQAPDNWHTNATWAESTPTARKKKVGGLYTVIESIPGQGAAGSGWVLGSCVGNKYFCYSNNMSNDKYSSRRPRLMPRRQCVIDKNGNVDWELPYTPPGRSTVGCCDSCDISDGNKGSCAADADNRDANGIPYE
jgi:hypothetical protein